MTSTLHIPGKPRISNKLRAHDVLWRYLDAAKYFDFLENSTIFFCRADNLEDKFEGAFTPSLKQKIEAAYQDRGIDFTYAQFKRRMRETVFINCWHRNADDSAAMWALYGKSNCAVAVTTTVGQLRDSLQEQALPYDLAIEKVEYVKHWRDPALDIAPYARVFAYKTKAYEHEREVRVLLDRSLTEFDAEMPKGGMPILVNPSTLLRSVVLAPEAPIWFEALVRKASSRSKLPAPVRNSKLAAEPI